MAADPSAPLRQRKSLTELEAEWQKGNKKPLDDLVRAWHYIQNLPPGDPNSFFQIGGYHGEPFRGAGWGNVNWWGGYCNHGNVLFPTWHRAYLLRLEDALRRAPGCADVAMPYWDELSVESATTGLPPSLLARQWTFADGSTMDNPLRSYKLGAAVWDNISVPRTRAGGGSDNDPVADYSKPVGYETVRYPFSGLVGPDDIAETTRHNAEQAAKGIQETDRMLNDNVKNWLGTHIDLPDDQHKTLPDGQPKTKPRATNTAEKYRRCLLAPNYTVFSNTTSAMQYNEDTFNVRRWAPDGPASEAAVPLEQPHNDMHLAIGGFDIKNVMTASPCAGANGDMGENDTASFDPLFFFHHAFIDKVFWDWQKKAGKTDEFEIDVGYPGTNSVDAQGPTPGVAANIWLSMDSPLDPFNKPDGTPYTSKDVVNIKTQLGYDYIDPPSTPYRPLPMPAPPTEGVPEGVKEQAAADNGAGPAASAVVAKPKPTPYLRVSDLNRAAVAGSFAVHIIATVKGGGDDGMDKSYVVASDGVLSRWHVQGCANCQTHTNLRAYLPLPKALAVVQTRKAMLGESDGDEVDPSVTKDEHGRPQLKDEHGRTVTYEARVQVRRLPEKTWGLMQLDPLKPTVDIGFLTD